MEGKKRLKLKNKSQKEKKKDCIQTCLSRYCLKSNASANKKRYVYVNTDWFKTDHFDYEDLH